MTAFVECHDEMVNSRQQQKIYGRARGKTSRHTILSLQREIVDKITMKMGCYLVRGVCRILSAANTTSASGHLKWIE